MLKFPTQQCNCNTYVMLQLHCWVGNCNINVILLLLVFIGIRVCEIKLKNRLTRKNFELFPSSIAITVFVVKTVAWRSAHNSFEKRNEKREATKQLPADTRNIVTFLFRVTFNFQAGTVSCPQPHALYTL